MAAADYFLKIDGIQGESQDEKHKNEIQLESWSLGATQSGTLAAGGGGGAGKVQMQDFHFVKRIDKSGPKLFQYCATGEHIPNIVLVCRKAGKQQQEYLKITMKECLISSYHISGSGGNDIVPMEEGSINFAQIEKEYAEQKPDGTLGGRVKMQFNLKTMKASA